MQQNALTGFLAVFLADLLVRTAYMSGKSPVLPVLADRLGAGEVLLGAIVSVSVLTGVLLKPLFGFLSDRGGRRAWLLAGTMLFAVTPVLYLWVETSSGLVALRLFHGLATAIYGPVTLAYVAELGAAPRAERFGWFGLARTGGYILGPLVGGALLQVMEPAQVFAATGLIAALAFAPLALMPETPNTVRVSAQTGDRMTLAAALRAAARNRPLAGFAVVEMSAQIGVYAVKTFLPLMILTAGGTPFAAGLFLSLQESANALTRPLAGRLADRSGRPVAVACTGLAIMALALALLPGAVTAETALPLVALAIGAGQGFYGPAAFSLIAVAANGRGTGTAFGAVGALRNLGKLIGPVAAGWLLFMLPAQQAFLLLGAVPLLTVIALIRGRSRTTRHAG